MDKVQKVKEFNGSDIIESKENYTYFEIGQIGKGLKTIKDMVFDIEKMIEVGQAISDITDIMQVIINVESEIRKIASAKLENLNNEQIDTSKKVLKMQDINKTMIEDLEKANNKVISKEIVLPNFTKSELMEWVTDKSYGNKKVHGDKAFVLTPNFFIQCKSIID